LLRRSEQATVHETNCEQVHWQLVPGSFEVYPPANYGALEIGIHRFHHPGHDDTEPAGEAKFILLWQNSKGAWALTRVVSFDHQSMPK
jgi:hypothetical protein